jgi:hypothetical protein
LRDMRQAAHNLAGHKRLTAPRAFAAKEDVTARVEAVSLTVIQ